MKPVLKILLLLNAVVLFSAVAFAQEIRMIETPQMKKFVYGKTKVAIVDARPAAEYAAGHIPGAINIPPEKYNDVAGHLPKDKARAVIFYCRGYS